jgi:hypothetical protein
VLPKILEAQLHWIVKSHCNADFFLWWGLGSGDESWPCLVRKNFQDFPSHRILGRMHVALNKDNNKN